MCGLQMRGGCHQLQLVVMQRQPMRSATACDSTMGWALRTRAVTPCTRRKRARRSIDSARRGGSSVGQSPGLIIRSSSVRARPTLRASEYRERSRSLPSERGGLSAQRVQPSRHPSMVHDDSHIWRAAIDRPDDFPKIVRIAEQQMGSCLALDPVCMPRGMQPLANEGRASDRCWTRPPWLAG